MPRRSRGFFFPPVGLPKTEAAEVVAPPPTQEPAGLGFQVGLETELDGPHELPKTRGVLAPPTCVPPPPKAGGAVPKAGRAACCCAEAAKALCVLFPKVPDDDESDAAVENEDVGKADFACC